MNRKYYFNNMWWGWVTGDICCICHGIMILNTDYCSGVFLSAEWFCIRLPDGVLKIQPCNLPGFFTDTLGKMGLLAVYTGTVFILSLPLTLIYILSVIIKAVCKIDSLSYILFKCPRTYSLFPQAFHQSVHR